MWEHLDAKYKDRRPITVTGEDRPDLFGMNSFWYVDGKTFPHPVGQGVTIYATPVTMERAKKKPFSIGSQTLGEPLARVKDMDSAGVGVQVNFPTLFLEPLTDDPAFEAALMRAYNSYMAAQCSQVADRLKWAAQLPLRDVPAAVAEVRRAKELGAVAAATTYGTLGERPLEQPWLDPIWAELEKQGLPLCIHCGWSNPGITGCFDTSYGAHVLGFTLPVLMAFYAFTGGGILDRFPNLKLAFLEAGCGWLPYFMDRMDEKWQPNRSPLKKKPSAYVRGCPICISAEVYESALPLAIAAVGAEHLFMASDFPHELDLPGYVAQLDEWRNLETLSETDREHILRTTALTAYGLG